jgi:hypothetical protein
MGLISFIPRSEVAGLQVVDYDANLWVRSHVYWTCIFLTL